MRSALVVLALLAGGGGMGFPRGRIQTTKDAINRRLLTAGQEGRYAPEDWIRPATMDGVSAERYVIASTGTGGSWVVTRLKGVVRQETFKAVEFFVENSGATTARFVVALCEYTEDATRVRVREFARASVYIPSPPVTRRTLVDLSRPVTLYPGATYAVAVFVDNAGAGAGFYMAPESSAGQPLLWGGGMMPARTADEFVEFSTDDADVDVRVPVTSPDSTAVPYVAMVRGFATDAWY